MDYSSIIRAHVKWTIRADGWNSKEERWPLSGKQSIGVVFHPYGVPLWTPTPPTTAYSFYFRTLYGIMSHLFPSGNSSCARHSTLGNRRMKIFPLMGSRSDHSDCHKTLAGSIKRKFYTFSALPCFDLSWPIHGVNYNFFRFKFHVLWSMSCYV